MNTLTFNSRSQHDVSVLESARRSIIAFFQGIRDGVEMADRYRALSRMSDEQLAKRGLTRANLTRAVVLGTGRR